MSADDTILQMTREIRGQWRLYGPEDIDFTAQPLDDLDNLDVFELTELVLECKTIVSAIYTLREELELRVAENLRPGGALRYGDNFVRYGTTPNRKLRTEFFDWVRENADTVAQAVSIIERVVSTSSPKVTGIDVIAETIGDDAQEMREKFIEETPSGSKLLTMPVSSQYAPKYAAKMSDGEIRRKKVTTKNLS